MGNFCAPTLCNDLTIAEWQHATIAPSARHVATVIWLHGLGDSGLSWYKCVIEAKPLPHVKYIFPSAPFRSVTLNGGMAMPAWFDIYGLRPEDKEDEAGINRSSVFLAQIIAREIKQGISPNNIAVVGFSQGGALAAHTCFRTLTYQLGAVVLLSSYVPLATSFAPSNNNTPTLVCHGDRDMLIPAMYAHKSVELLKSHRVPTELKLYRGLAHASNTSEMADVCQFLARHLNVSLPSHV
ncbi:hypothetical protein, variant [Aphanomyces invadans]|uniref:Phospholipase/carboxylesterase/thioesterase domain-containing protein n=1 Tax=Aphanomyces invadans TaxID=157072 RepID=A0A024UEV5_9STRA|nr:hypothetical protein, variant [Aphanomyces invadans]XP_008866252.1 hypothetical protein H310_03945 [Aphanomyces invadans]ETW04813.1 hypothetical protein H310_03945 [Aphanomyces invadans]ETW04814.1 hypothetical protein, variant [Aphanomyces invadans]RHY32069.1 hypothetical protein DYB32_002902 [Aphanomyces invadans]|eukprot:XP_008866251.1 hypothetical protein, variant [Aphanomyces invadans]